MAKKKATKAMAPKRRGGKEERKLEVVDRTGTVKKFEPSSMDDLKAYAASGALSKGKVPDNLPVRELEDGEKDLVVAVFANHHRNMALRVAVHPDGWTDYLCLEQGVIDLQQMLSEDFHEFYFNRYPGYPISEAIRHFTNPRTPGIIVSDEARLAIEKINLKAVAPKQTVKPRKEKTMLNEDNDRDDDNEDTGNKASKKKVSKKKAAAPAAKKKAAAPAAKKKAAAKDDEKGTGGRTSPYAGKKIKVLTKDVGARAGTLREAIRTAVIKAKKVDDVLGETVSADGREAIITGTVIANMVAAGIIAVE